MPAPTIQELEEALQDINDLESFINGATPEDITTRLGTIYPNLLKVTQLVTAGSATGVGFDNNNSFLNSLTVQAAIDELANGSSFFFKDYNALRDMFNSSFDGSTLVEGQFVHVTDPGIAGAFALRRFDSNTDSNALIDNGGTIIVIDSDWYAQRIYYGGIRPEWFGAVADATTESGAALQAAITEAETTKQPLLLSNGGYLNNATNLVATDRITIVGENKEDTYIITTASLTGVILTIDTSGTDAEEFLLDRFRIQNDSASAITTGILIKPSYGRLRDIIVKTSTDFSIAAIDTNETVNVNQMIYDNVEVRSQSNPGGTLGLWHRRGANVTIIGGYYGDYDTGVRLGSVSEVSNGEIVTNVDICGGTLMETFDPQNASDAVCLHLDGISAIRVQGRFQLDAAGHRCIKVTQRLRGGVISGCSFDGTGQALSAITFDGNATEQARGIEIFGNEFNSVGSASTNPIELINGADPDIYIGVNSYNGTANKTAIDQTLSVNDSTPSVGPGNVFVTANTLATTIIDLDGVARENQKIVTIVFGDANTTVDFTTPGTQMRGNGGVDWSPSIGDSMICTHVDQVWYCIISPSGE
jgi:hypothetical protein